MITRTLASHQGWDRSDMSFARPESQASTRIHLYIMHEQPMVAESLSMALGHDEDIEIVGMQTTTDQVEERLITSGADVVLLDATIEPGRLDAIIQAARETARIIVLATEPDPVLMVRCLTAGVAGFLIGPRALADLPSAIRRARERWLVLTHEQLMALLARPYPRVTNPYAAALCDRLSERECDVLRALATGASTDEVATHLLISTHTVHSHVKNAMRKLHVRTKLMAVVLAFAAGIVEGPDGRPSGDGAR